MPTIGEQLRAARLDQNLTLDEISEMTRIRPDFLDHLECGQYGKLPGRFFVASFVNQFAEAVGLDGRDLAKAALSELGATELSVPDDPVPVNSHLSASIWKGVWSRSRHLLRTNAGSFAKVLVPVVLIIGGLIMATESYRLSRGGDTDSQQPEQPATALTQEEDAIQPVANGSGLGIAEPAPADDQRPAGIFENTRAGSFAIEIRASEVVWVRAVVEGATEREATLQPGERMAFLADSVAYASLGNAGGAALVIDGEDQGVLGESGQVRHVRITEDGWTPVSRSDF